MRRKRNCQCLLYLASQSFKKLWILTLWSGGVRCLSIGGNKLHSASLDGDKKESGRGVGRSSCMFKYRLEQHAWKGLEKTFFLINWIQLYLLAQTDTPQVCDLKFFDHILLLEIEKCIINYTSSITIACVAASCQLPIEAGFVRVKIMVRVLFWKKLLLQCTWSVGLCTTFDLTCRLLVGVM